MLTRVQARLYRCLKSTDQTLGSFDALVGPNASGKTTFLDVIGLLSDLVKNRGDVLAAVQSRSSNFENLVWMGEGRSFQVAVEAQIPANVVSEMADDKKHYTRLRYELEFGLEQDSDEIGLNFETLWLMEPPAEKHSAQRTMFPELRDHAPSLQLRSAKTRRVAITKRMGGNDNYYTEGRKSYMPSFKLGRGKSALANIPADSASFPVSTWFRNLLDRGIQRFVLNSQVIRQPSAPGLVRQFQPDGSNLPWVIADLRKEPKRFNAWLAHVRTALEDVKDIDTVERPEDRHRYLIVEYGNGARVPSWLVSDGTLRLLALTIPAYLPDFDGTFLIEEPENGIHPRAIETVLQSLTSLYRGQVLVATHSPIALNMVDPKEVLCFAKDDSGATDIVSGDLHPALREWKRGQPDLGVLFASGILS